MNLFSNPVIVCGVIALAIILILVVVVVICCKRSETKERQELLILSDEIDANVEEMEQPDKIEDVLNKMQEALENKEENIQTFEEQQEERAIISYQELLDSLGTNKIDIDSIGVFEDELENQIEISDMNKEIIDSYQNNDLQKEMYKFQNDYSYGAMPIESEQLNEIPIMNLEMPEENIVEEPTKEVLNLSNNVATRKFKKTKIISPVYGIVNNEVRRNASFTKEEDVEEIVFEDDSLLDDF